MLSEGYQRLIRSFADPSQGASAGQQMPAPQQDPSQQQQLQNNQGQAQGQQDQGQDQGQTQQQLQEQQAQQQMQAEAQKDQITNDVMSKVASGTVYLMARNMAIKKGFQPGTAEFYRYIGEAIEVGSGCSN